MSRFNSLSTYIWIFSIGRGSAAFIRTGLNQGFIVDMGGGNLFDPAEFIKKNFLPRLESYPLQNGSKIAQAILSHPHSDHIAQCAYLKSGEKLYPSLLTCPHDKESLDGLNERVNWQRIINLEGTEEVIKTYKGLYHDRQLPLQTIHFDSHRTVPNLEYGIYYVQPPVCEKIHDSDDNKYGNTLSIMLYFRHGDHTILFPGDMTPEGVEHILNEGKGIEKRYTKFNREFSQSHPEWHLKTLNQPTLKSLLKEKGLSVLIAPHHGLESCYSQDLYDAMCGRKPKLVVISERRHKKDTDGKVDVRYQSENGASGLTVQIDGEERERRSISTINGHHILIVFAGTGQPRVYADKDPLNLLKY